MIFSVISLLGTFYSLIIILLLEQAGIMNKDTMEAFGTVIIIAALIFIFIFLNGGNYEKNENIDTCKFDSLKVYECDCKKNICDCCEEVCSDKAFTNKMFDE